MEIYCDGACEPVNPGGQATWGFVAFVDGQEVHAAHGTIGQGAGMTNQIAEYTAVLTALQWAYRAGHRGVTLKTDAQLVVKQINGDWQVKADHLRDYVARCQKGLALCEGTLVWIAREQNMRADAESRKPLRVPADADAPYFAALGRIDQQSTPLTDWETAFLDSVLSKRKYGLSTKQKAVIRRLAETYLGEPAAAELAGQTPLFQEETP